MEEMQLFEIELSIAPEPDSEVEEGELEAAADVVLEAIRREGAFVALGAVVSLDLSASSIELFCNVSGDRRDELHGKVARLFDIMLHAANGFVYGSSATQRLESVPA